MLHDQTASTFGRPKKSPDEIVRAAYRKFGRGRCCREAVRLGLGQKGGDREMNEEGTAK
ncbi:MAG: hypothetical protein ABI318_15830 [Chthoniobacteraceae bacterium]